MIPHKDFIVTKFLLLPRYLPTRSGRMEFRWLVTTNIVCYYGFSGILFESGWD